MIIQSEIRCSQGGVQKRNCNFYQSQLQKTTERKHIWSNGPIFFAITAFHIQIVGEEAKA